METRVRRGDLGLRLAEATMYKVSACGETRLFRLRDPLFDRPVAGYPEMSGALQDLKGDDELHLCSGD